MAMDRKVIGEQVRALRTSRKLSLRAAAKVAGVSHAYIQQVETARENANITLNKLEKIADGLGGRVDVRLLANTDRLDATIASLSPEEREILRTFARALHESGEKPQLAPVIQAAAGMLAQMLPAEAESSG